MLYVLYLLAFAAWTKKVHVVRQIWLIVECVRYISRLSNRNTPTVLYLVINRQGGTEQGSHVPSLRRSVQI